MEFLWVFLIGVLLAAAALLPAAAMRVHLTAKMAELRAHYKKLMGKLEAEALEARFSVDRDGRIRTFNHRAEQLFGFHHQEILGKTADLVFLVSRSVLPSYVIESLYKSNRSADKQGLEVTGRRKDGTYFPMELHISESGGYLNRKFYLTVRDLSERARAQETEQELQFLAGILQYAGPPILVLDVAGRVVRHNTAFERVTGYTTDEITQETYWGLLLREEERDQVHLSIRELIAGSGAVAVTDQVEWLSKDGKRLPFQVSITAIPGDEERVGLALLVAFEQQTAAAAPAASTADVEKLATGVAGEFNSVVASISGRCELLLHRLGDNDTRRDVEAILSASERAAALGNQLLDVSFKMPPGEVATFELNDIILDLKPVLKSLLGDQIQLTASLGPENTALSADRKSIEHLILNLAINARDSMPEGGKMSIETTVAWLDEVAAHRAARLPEGNYVVLTVSDTGSGIQLVQRARAFDPYHTPSQGAGLPAVLSVVRQMGGNAVMQSIPDSGVSVRIFLPSMETHRPYLVRGVAVS